MRHRQAQSGLRWAMVFAVGGGMLGAFGTACSSGEDFTASSGGAAAASGDAGTSGGSGGSGAAGTGGTSTGKSNGESCQQAEDCSSQQCVDGVCCNAPCNGTCESCDLASAVGTCTPHAAGTDPGGECVGAGAAADPCAGKCDGLGSCEFPDGAQACGASSCTAGKQSGLACDGQGACKQAEVDCGAYACGSTTCLTSCTTGADCADGFWCNSGICETKKDDGKACAATVECKSGLCEQSVCCNTACAAPSSCATGTCTCGGNECAAGDQCITWYADTDGDGFGNAGVSKLDCSSASTSGWSKNDTDCFDGNKDAFPGQTKYFDVHRGDGKFDYDCDNTPTPLYPNVAGKSCGLCKPSGPGGCIASLCVGGWGCGACPSSGPAEGFNGSVACGTDGTLLECAASMVSGSCNSSTGTKPATKQACK